MKSRDILRLFNNVGQGAAVEIIPGRLPDLPPGGPEPSAKVASAPANPAETPAASPQPTPATVSAAQAASPTPATR